jgi:hypothetical protein
MAMPFACFGASTKKNSTLTALASILALGSTALAQSQDKTFPPANTASVLPRHDFQFPGNVGRTFLDSDPAQFRSQCKLQKARPTSC